jgi:hypothetical protein
MRMSTKQRAKQDRVTYPLVMERPLDTRITKAAAKVGISKQAVMRLSIERGLDVLLAQLESEPVKTNA